MGDPGSAAVPAALQNQRPGRPRSQEKAMDAPIATAEELRAALTAFRHDAKHGTLDTGRYRMRFFVWGSGPPLVFVHGMADAARAFVMVMHRLSRYAKVFTR